MSTAARERVGAELANGQDATNPAFTFSCTSTALLLAMADGQINPVRLARAELANRGLDADGVWCGFDRSREIHTSDHACAAATTADAAAAEIAQRTMGIATIETRNSDALDFHNVAVWQIKEALAAAFAAGQAAAK